MGADAEIYVFDYQRYRTEVVPALVDLVRTGEPGPYLTAFLRDTAAGHRMDFGARWPRIAANLRLAPTDLARHCTWLGDDLRHRYGPRSGPRPVERRHDLRCPSRSCPQRGHCPLAAGRQDTELLNILYEALVWTRCLDRPQFVGRTVDVSTYQPLLDDLGVPAAAAVRELLTALGSRGAVMGYVSGVTEGVHGWLTETETAQLAHHLSALPLPAFAADYPTMRHLHRLNLSRSAQARLAGRDLTPADGPAWLELSLAFVRTVATIAAAEGRAVLWGNDVGYDQWIDYFLD